MFRFGGQQGQQQNQQGMLPQSLQQAPQQQQQQQQQNQLQNILQQLQSPGGAAQLLARTNLGLEQQQPVQNQPIAQQQMQQAIQQQPQQNVPQFDLQQPPQGQVIRGALSKQKPGQEAINQGLIERRNAPYTKQHEARYDYAKDASLLAKQMLDLLNTGKVQSGPAGGFFGTRTQNAETQQFNSKGKELAILNAGKGRGPSTDFKIRTAQETKPLLEQQQEAQYELLYDLLDKVDPELKDHDIIERLTLANNGLEPENLKQQVAIQKMLPNPEDCAPNSIGQFHGKIFAVDPSGLKWNLIKG
jgi:hypothetical protein